MAARPPDSNGPMAKPAHEIGPIPHLDPSARPPLRSPRPPTQHRHRSALLRKRDFTLPQLPSNSARPTITGPRAAYQGPSSNGKPIARKLSFNPAGTGLPQAASLYQTYGTSRGMLAPATHHRPLILGSGLARSPMNSGPANGAPTPNPERSHPRPTRTSPRRRAPTKPFATDEKKPGRPPQPHPLLRKSTPAKLRTRASKTPAGNNPTTRRKQRTGPRVPTEVLRENKTNRPQPTLHAISTPSTQSHKNPATRGPPVVYDMGQNMVGNMFLSCPRHRGTIIPACRFAEGAFNPAGSIYTKTSATPPFTTPTSLRAKRRRKTYTPGLSTSPGFATGRGLGTPGTPQPTAGNRGLVYDSLPLHPLHPLPKLPRFSNK